MLLAVERQFAAALLAASLEEADFHVHWTATPERAGQLAHDGDPMHVLTLVPRHQGTKAPSA